MEKSSLSPLLDLGPAVAVTILLSDWCRYSLSERLWYHFCLTNALTGSKEQTRQSSKEREYLNQQKNQNFHFNNVDELLTSKRGFASKSFKIEEVCGVARLLECIPTKQWHKLLRRHKKQLKNSIRSFNDNAVAVRKKKDVFCHEPEVLPLPMNPYTRVVFAYEITRIAFCVDASPSLTSTFGFSMSQKSGYERECCPMDRLPNMTRSFFMSLIEPITTPSASSKVVWSPILAVTVLAVYPRASGGSPTSVLVRDYRVTDKDSAALLCKKIEEWAFGVVETEIARRLSHPCIENQQEIPGSLVTSYDAGVIPMYSSSLRDLLNASDAALTSLSSDARPCIVVATDCRSVVCEGVIDMVSDADRIDTPLVVLDLSNRNSHSNFSSSHQYLYQEAREADVSGYGLSFNLTTYDPGGATFPLHLSDDSEALHSLCGATGGCFFDSDLLHEAAKSKAGLVDPSSPLSADHYFSFKRHSIQPNGVQWYILFSLSQLSEAMYSTTMGKVVQPDYLRIRFLADENTELTRKSSTSNVMDPRQVQKSEWQSGIMDGRRITVSKENHGIDVSGGLSRRSHARKIFSTYIINPIPIQGILLMRVKEGYRAKQYGQNTSDPGRVSIQMILPLDLGIVLHYELSYSALPGELFVGFAHIKIELSGDVNFIGMMKSDFLQQNQRNSSDTAVQQFSERICRLLRWIRKEDMLLSHLSPLNWSNQLSSPDTMFVKRLGTLSRIQRMRFFRCDQFDCVCVGRMPWIVEDDLFRDFKSVDNGELELIELITDWATQTIEKEAKFVRRTGSVGGLGSYCMIELKRSSIVSRLVTVKLEISCGSGSSNCALLSYLKNMIAQIKEIQVLPKQLGQNLVRSRLSRPSIIDRKERIFESQLNHDSWDLVQDSELLSLLMRRRSEIGKFLLLDSADDRVVFAKLVETPTTTLSDPGDLLQYHLAVLQDKVLVDVYMENEGGVFLSNAQRSSRYETVKKATFGNKTKFQRMVMILQHLDQECGHALKCRTSLLNVFNDSPHIFNSEEEENHLWYVRKLLPYASKLTVRLRFFVHEWGSANTILQAHLEDTLISQSFGAKVAKLPIEFGNDFDDLGGGVWYVIEFDKQTMSMVHLSLAHHCEVSDADGRSFSYREMTFFTFGITDLYNKKDDIADDGSDDGHISEYLCVSSFQDAILSAHKKNYAVAAYLALKRDDPLQNFYFDLDDFAEVMSSLTFIEVARVLVSGEWGVNRVESKLMKLVSSVLYPVSDESYCLFYNGKEQSQDLLQISGDDSEGSDCESSSGELSTYEVDDVTDESQQQRDDINSDTQSVGNDSIELNDADYYMSPPPIFVRFLRDDNPVAITELTCIEEESCTLSILVSVFSGKNSLPEANRMDRSELPATHVGASIELASLLNAYVAEETLERLRRNGPAILTQGQDSKLVKSCLKKARNVLTSNFDILFYIGRIDDVVSASAPVGSNIEVDDAFNLLHNELMNDKNVSMKPLVGDDCLLVDCISPCGSFTFWCIVYIQRAHGRIRVKIHHPSGASQAFDVLNSVLEKISISCHRVNQLLLLRRLHQGRSASRFLVTPESDVPDSKKQLYGDERESTFHGGYFSCPIVYQTTFELFHRYATNPNQVARSLAATVLHVFEVSNRKQLFVYKDESGSIFYMRLLAVGGGSEANGQLILYVHGLDTPGYSVTSQLRRLLQKRLLVIAVDMLSTVLIKNPHYSWRLADIRFIQTYELEWIQLDRETEHCPNANNRTYLFPAAAYDPGMILLYFRQNLCGSTFFHRFVSSEWSNEKLDDEASCDGATLRLGPTDLLFYYNNSPSKLDPKFQSQSTLTDKGAELSRAAGSGIAIIELCLLDWKGRRMLDLRAANKPVVIDSIVDLSKDDLQFQIASIPESNANAYDSESVFVNVKITDTALQRDVLHEWILLTLNQVLVSWMVERIFERKQRGLYHPCSITTGARQPTKDIMKKFAVETICCGLPLIQHCLEVGAELPHPAMLKSDFNEITRSSSVASMALDLLDNAVFEQLKAETKSKLTFEKPSYVVVRSNRNFKPRRVHLRWDSSKQQALVIGSDGIISDSPVDCPEYTIFYCFPEYEESRQGHDVSLPKLFEEVAVGGDRNVEIGDSKSLQAVKELNYFACRRSFAFIFSVKKNRRTFFAYNWAIALFKTVSSRLREIDNLHVVSAQGSVDRLQIMSLKHLSPRRETSHDCVAKLEKSLPIQRNSSASKLKDMSSKSSNHTIQEENDVVLASRRVARPLFIRKPKLVGKSEDTVLSHAVAASRTRASANRFRGSNQPTKTISKQTGDEIDKKSAINKVVAPVGTSQTPILKELKKDGDDEMSKARDDLITIVNKDNGRRISTEQRTEHQFLICSLWPLKWNQRQEISNMVATFLFRRGFFAWQDVAEVPAIPAKYGATFFSSFGNSLSRLCNLSFVPVINSNDSIFLTGQIRNVRSCKCFLVLWLTSNATVVAGMHKNFLSCEGRIFFIPRQMDLPQQLSGNRQMEKDATALDKLSVDFKNNFNGLERSVYEHCCTSIERSMKSVEGELDYAESFSLLQQLIVQYPLTGVMLLNSNYKAFRVHIVLSSYRDKLLNGFDGVTLLSFFQNNPGEGNFVSCGADALCFKQEVVVSFTRSICFITSNKEMPGKLDLSILCRTKGKNLRGFMFREGSNVATTVLDNIVINAAGLAYHELRKAALSLQCNILWKLVVASNPSEPPSSEQIKDLLRLSSILPILSFIQSKDERQRFVMICQSIALVDIQSFFSAIGQDPSFQPSWTVPDGGKQVVICFMNSEDIFLLFTHNINESNLQIDIVQRNSNLTETNKPAMAVQKLANYILHFIWTESF